MYRYDESDTALVQARARQFKNQVARRLSGEITEDEFKPLRLQNGLYMQVHSYMLRIAVPYGLLSSDQMRVLAHIARRYDRGYGHFTTRQNIQFNWPDLEDVPLILDELAAVGMHAIQSSGNCIRNTTSDPFAGVAADELEDPRPYCEFIRQWSTFHPEFAFLPRKFKVAVTGATNDRAAIAFHDIGLRIIENEAGERGFEVQVGGGQGRTPVIASVIRPFLAKADLLTYLEAILRVYNRHGRRDNKYKARIKILVTDLGVERFGEQVEQEWQHNRESGLKLTDEDLTRMEGFFEPQAYLTDLAESDAVETARLMDPDFGRWLESNTVVHRQPGYTGVLVTLKNGQLPPGDATHQQMDSLADLADAFSGGSIVVTHRQNLALPDVQTAELHRLWRQLKVLGLGTPNGDHISDSIACPGLDYCSLASARSIDIAQGISERFESMDKEFGLGPIHLNISGCINACGHHHIGHIGILGINKLGQEFYQLTLGGSSGFDASIGEVVGPAFSRDEISDALNTVLETYLEVRSEEVERFLDTYRRVGPGPFKEALYGN